MDIIIDIFITSYFGSIFWIAIGIYQLRSFQKKKDDDSLFQDTQRVSSNIRGFGIVIGSFALGLIIAYSKITGAF